jgi:hypothetical protein
VKFDGTGDLCVACLACRETEAMKKALTALQNAYREECIRWSKANGPIQSEPTAMMFEMGAAIAALQVEVVQR